MVSRDGAARAVAQRSVDLLIAIGPSVPVVDTRDAVIDVLRGYGEPDPITISDSDMTGLREAATALWPVFTATTTGQAAERLNFILGTYGHPPRLSRHDGSVWHLHIDSSDDGAWAPWFASSSAMAIATLLTDRQANPAGQCSSPSCERPFIDLGQGDTRRYCSPRCASRERAAAHRLRHNTTADRRDGASDHRS